jgi:hypothetical protein
MDDAHFFEAWFPILEAKDLITVQKPLDKAAHNYYQNMHRVHESLLSTACFVGVAARMAWAEAMANYDVENEAAQGLELPSGELIDDYRSARSQHYILEQIRLDEEHEGGPTRRFYGQAGQFMLNAMKRYPVFPLKGGLDAILSSAVIHASAAMELCLKQVCKIACTQPVIGDRLALKKVDKDTNKPRIFHLAQDQRGVPRMTPKNGLKGGFASMGGLRVEYALAFHFDSSDIDDAMASYDLEAVALVRNLLLHHNGCSDEQFRGQAEGIPILATARSLPDGTKIPLEGSFVSELLTSSLQAVKRVVISVDQWLQRNN